MNFDIFGKVVVLNNLASLEKVLSEGYKKIYLRQSYRGELRVPPLKWVSPYKEKVFDSKIILKENNNLFYLDLKETYFSNRYATDRKKLQEELLKESLNGEVAIIGSGIGPYTILASKTFQAITTYEVNSNSNYYAKINYKLNNISSKIIMQEKPYKNEVHDNIISIMPSKPLEYHKKYKFRNTLLFYFITSTLQIEKVVNEYLHSYSVTNYSLTEVRPYSKFLRVYRLRLLRQAI